MGMVAALAMSGLAGGANLIKSATNLLSSKERPNAMGYKSAAEGVGHSRAYNKSSGNYRGVSKRRIRFHPTNSGLPFNAEFGYLNKSLNGRALQRYFEMVEALHGPEKAAKERAQAGWEVAA